MHRIDDARTQDYRRHTYRLPPTKPLASQTQARNFVDQRGFVFLWPIKGVDLPSLWTAVAGDRPVAEAHDDPGHVTWGWKDDALPRRIWYYAKVLRRKATVISLETAPFFYALSQNFGSFKDDHLVAYEQGQLTLAARNIYDALLTAGPLDSIALRKAARMAGARESEWNRALEDLQMDFKIMPVAVAEAGSWRYAFVYDIAARHYPELPKKARKITESKARQTLLTLYLESVGVCRERDILKLFGWPPELVARALAPLLRGGQVVEAEHPKQGGDWLALGRLAK
jgi:hypothetical protein